MNASTRNFDKFTILFVVIIPYDGEEGLQVMDCVLCFTIHAITSFNLFSWLIKAKMESMIYIYKIDFDCRLRLVLL